MIHSRNRKPPREPHYWQWIVTQIAMWAAFFWLIAHFV